MHLQCAMHLLLQRRPGSNDLSSGSEKGASMPQMGSPHACSPVCPGPDSRQQSPIWGTVSACGQMPTGPAMLQCHGSRGASRFPRGAGSSPRVPGGAPRPRPPHPGPDAGRSCATASGRQQAWGTRLLIPHCSVQGLAKSYMGLYGLQKDDAWVLWGRRGSQVGSEECLLHMQLYGLPMLPSLPRCMSSPPLPGVHRVASRLPCVLRPGACKL